MGARADQSLKQWKLFESLAIMEQLKEEGTFGDCLVQCPAQSRGRQSTLPRTLSILGDSTMSLGNLFWYLTALAWIKFSLFCSRIISPKCHSLPSFIRCANTLYHPSCSSLDSLHLYPHVLPELLHM